MLLDHQQVADLLVPGYAKKGLVNFGEIFLSPEFSLRWEQLKSENYE